MDFTKTEASKDLSGLVATIVESVCTPQHQKHLDSLDQRHDTVLWSKLIDADVLSTAAPESVGGGGYGVLEQTAILTALGRQIAAVPYLESVVLAGGALAHFGSPALQQDWAAPAVAGKKIVTVALDGEFGQAPVKATAAGEGYRLTGTRTQVPFGPVADAFLVPAETDSGTAVFLVPAGPAGVVLSWLSTHRALGLAAYQLGVLERALELTADYARTREQFGRPIGSFQAVGQRLADDYIEIKGLRLTVEQASWRLSEDLPADMEVATAAFWAAEAGHRVAHTTVHVHGGVGIDMDHPVHRYFITAKQTEFAIGGATAALRAIGRELADTPA